MHACINNFVFFSPLELKTEPTALYLLDKHSTQLNPQSLKSLKKKNCVSPSVLRGRRNPGPDKREVEPDTCIPGARLTSRPFTYPCRACWLEMRGKQVPGVATILLSRPWSL